MLETYEEKLAYMKKELDVVDKMTPPHDESFLKLVCLVSYITTAQRKKKPEVTPMIILNNAAGKADMEWSKTMYERISLLSEVLMVNTNVFPTFGHKNMKDMMGEIKEIMDGWVPF